MYRFNSFKRDSSAVAYIMADRLPWTLNVTAQDKNPEIVVSVPLRKLNVHDTG